MSSHLYRSINDQSHDLYYHFPSRQHDRNDDDIFSTPSSQLTPSLSSTSLALYSSPSFGYPYTLTPSSSSSSPSTSSSSSSSTLNRASIPALTFTLSNTILGAGVLGIAHAFATSGYLLGLVLLLFAAAASAFGLHLLAASARSLRTSPPTASSFYTVARACLPSAAPLIDLAVAIKCFGVSISYLIVIGDLIPTAVASIFPSWTDPHQDGVGGRAAVNATLRLWLATSRRAWITLLMAGVALPLSCLRSLNALRFTSSISILFVSTLAVLITLYAFVPSTFDPCPTPPAHSDDNNACKGSTYDVNLSLDTMKVFPVFIFAFTCAQNIFTVHNELRNNSAVRVDTVIGSAVLLALFLYTILSCFAYHTYGDWVATNVLTSYPPTIALAVVRILIGINVAFTFPLQVNPCRNSVYVLCRQVGRWWSSPSSSDASSSSSSFPSPSSMPTSALLTLSLAICAASYSIAFFVEDLGTVLGVVGATGSTLISYILPGLFYVRLYRKWTWERLGAMLLCGFGLLVVPVCLTLIALGASGH